MSEARLRAIPKLPRRAVRDGQQQARYSTNHHEGNRPTGRGGSRRPTSNRNRIGAPRHQGSLLLPAHLPAGQLLHLDPHRHDPQEARSPSEHVGGREQTQQEVQARRLLQAVAQLPHQVLLDREPRRPGEGGQPRDVGAHQPHAEHKQGRFRQRRGVSQYRDRYPLPYQQTRRRRDDPRPEKVPSPDGRGHGQPHQKGAHCSKPIRLGQDDLPPAAREGSQPRAVPVHNLPPDPGEGHHAEFRQVLVQELPRLLRGPLGMERPSPHRPARQLDEHIREERRRPGRFGVRPQIRHDHPGRVREPSRSLRRADDGKEGDRHLELL